MLIRRGDVAAFPLYLSIPMANQCYVINVKLSMLRLTAQSRSTSNVIWIPEDLLKTKGSWLLESINNISQKVHAFQRSELFTLSNRLLHIKTKVFNDVRGKCTVFSFCMADSRLNWMFDLAPSPAYILGATAQSRGEKTNKLWMLLMLFL